MPSDPIAQEVAVSYLRQLHGCVAVWVGAMDMIWNDDARQLNGEDVIAAIGPVAQAHRDLAYYSVLPAMAAVHCAALNLLQSGMDALDAIAAGRGKPALREMQEQLTRFQVELVLFSKRAGLVD
jgi:hypothetical protein